MPDRDRTAPDPRPGPRRPRRARRTAVAAALASLALVAGCSADAAPPGQLNGQVVDPPFEPASTALTDTDGQPYSLTTSTDKRLTLVFFGYTHCPDICGIVMGNISSALTKLDDADRDQVDVVFVTTDPARDTSVPLRAYLDSYDPDKDDPDRAFVGLTGDIDTIAAVGKTIAVGVTSGERLPSGGYDLNTHNTQVTGIDSADEAPIYWSQDTTSTQLADDIHTLLGKPS